MGIDSFSLYLNLVVLANVWICLYEVSGEQNYYDKELLYNVSFAIHGRVCHKRSLYFQDL